MNKILDGGDNHDHLGNTSIIIPIFLLFSNYYLDSSLLLSSKEIIGIRNARSLISLFR